MEAFKAGDVIIPKDGRYPDDAMVVAIATEDGKISASAEGGGFVYKLHNAADWRLATEAEKAVPLRKAIFCFDDAPKFEGWHAGRRWNGWGMPLFTKAVADQVVAEQFPGIGTYDAAKNAFVLNMDGGEEPYIAEAAGVSPEGEALYDFGTLGFTWNVEEDAAQ